MALHIPLPPHGVVHLLRAWVLPVSSVGGGALGDGGDGALRGEGDRLIGVDGMGGEIRHEVERIEGAGVCGGAVVVGETAHGAFRGCGEVGDGGGFVHRA